MNNTQAQTSGAALVGLLAGFAAGHNWLGLSLSDWTTLITALAGAAAVVWPLVAARAQALKTQVGNLPNTTVVTDRDSAQASPSPDVVAATPKVIAAIKEAKAGA